VLALFRLLRPSTRWAGLRLAAALAVAAMVIVPVYLSYLAVATQSPDFSEQTIWLNPLVVPWTPRLLVGQEFLSQMAPVTLALLAVGVVFTLPGNGNRTIASTKSAWTAGALWFLIGLVLAAGPTMVIGSHIVSLPIYYLARIVPQLDRIRVPLRSGYAALTGTTILSGIAFAVISERCYRAGANNRLWKAIPAVLAALIVAGLYFDVGKSNMPPHSPGTYAAPVPPPSFVQALLAAPGPVLEAPLGGPDLEQLAHAVAMFHSIYHRQPILNGYSSYYPADFPRRMQLVAKLPDRQALADLRAQTGLRYLWIRAANLGPSQRANWQEYVSAAGNALRAVSIKGQDWLFEVTP
jgi:hypothetical protein